MEVTFKFIAYLIYLAFVGGTTFLVTHFLFKHGSKLLNQFRPNEEEMTKSLSSIMKIGFSLVALGFGFLIIKIGSDIGSLDAMIELASLKSGSFFVFIGAIMFFQLIIFLSMQKKKKSNNVELNMGEEH